MMSLAPVPSEGATCANCSAPLAADQRYCLSCGQPCSPVRLAFLDVLEAEQRPTQLGVGPAGTTPVAYTPYLEPAAGPAWLRRYSPLLAVASVLLLAMIVGLLVGHWVTQSKTPVAAAPEVVKIEGLSGTPLASATGASTPTTVPTTSAPPTATGKSKSSAKSEEEKEQAEAKAEEKAEEKTPAKAPAAKTLKSTDLNKLEKTTGKQHEAELNKLSKKRIKVE
jgi:hypothetical protein